MRMVLGEMPAPVVSLTVAARLPTQACTSSSANDGRQVAHCGVDAGPFKDALVIVFGARCDVVGACRVVLQHAPECWPVGVAVFVAFEEFGGPRAQIRNG